MVAPVTDNQAHPWVVENAVVDVVETARRVEHARRDLGAVQSLHRVHAGGAQRHAAGQPDDERAPSIVTEQQRHVGQQSLRRGVGHRRRVGLAVDP